MHSWAVRLTMRGTLLAFGCEGRVSDHPLSEPRIMNFWTQGEYLHVRCVAPDETTALALAHGQRIRCLVRTTGRRRSKDDPNEPHDMEWLRERAERSQWEAARGRWNVV